MIVACSKRNISSDRCRMYVIEAASNDDIGIVNYTGILKADREGACCAVKFFIDDDDENAMSCVTN